MKKILIFEDKYALIKPTLDLVNKKYFKQIFTFDNIPKIEENMNWNMVRDYCGIILDIELDKDSKRDGYGILDILIKEKYDKDKIVILTGHNLIDIKLKEKGLPIVDIVYKHVGVNDIKNILHKFNR